MAPAADADTYNACFCKYNKLQPFKSSTAGVCDSACPADPSGLGKIRTWFVDFCGANAGKAATPDDSAGAPTPASGSGSGSGPGSGSGSDSVSGSVSASDSSSSSGGGSGVSGDWLSNHWRWVVMIVIVVVAIVGIWTGACIWRRKYLRKQDRMYELGKGLPSSMAVNTQGNLVASASKGGKSKPAVFMPGSKASLSAGAAASGLSEKADKERKKWLVKEET